jgi:hypothetical protein
METGAAPVEDSERVLIKQTPSSHMTSSSTPVISPRQPKTLAYTKTCTQMFLSVLFIIAKR